MQSRATSRFAEVFPANVMTSEKRKSFNRLFFNLEAGWRGSFGLMLLLSAGIATLGLSEDSAAVVIGAMIVAPLGQPIIALGAAIVLGWPREMLTLLATILLGAVAVVVASFLLNLMLPVASPNDQILARTAPDLRDLGIAVFAGAAGAYGYWRSELSTVLAGVAIAVALAPPLCVAGMMLEAGHPILAQGALILFATNLVGILFAAILVFFTVASLTAPAKRKWFVSGLLGTLLAAALVAIPLTRNYGVVTHASQEKSLLFSQVTHGLEQAGWAEPVLDVELQGAQLDVTLSALPASSHHLAEIQEHLQAATRFQVNLLSPAHQVGQASIEPPAG